MLFSQSLNLLIQAIKTIDNTVVRVEILEQWQRLKIYGILFNKYLGLRKLEFLKREVEFSIGIQ